MELKNGSFYYSASDLAGYINCKHLVTLNRLAASGTIKKPKRSSLLLETLQLRGREFEEAYLSELNNAGKRIVKIDTADSTKAFADTMEAMRKGVDVIYQARLEVGMFRGWADFLIRVEQPSALGAWSYEVYDTKLTSETKAGTIIQIALYTEMLNELQGAMPEFMHVRHPKGFEQYRAQDFMAYFRLVKNNFLEMMAAAPDTYPDPVPHCEVCPWLQDCEKKRRADDHLGYVAGLGKLHMRELQTHGVNKLEALANLNLPIPFKPSRGVVKTYEKLQHQARLQLEAREQNQPVHELLPLEEGLGFYLLPEPHEDDIFLDLEGDPFVPPSGREYLFGYYHRGEYTALWAEDEEQEKEAFEHFIDLALQKFNESPDMHIYHFGAYETAALKRLMCKYATRVEQTDKLLRSKSFVDLHLIVRQSLRAGVEKYSLKHLEKYHGFLREADLTTVGPIKALYEMLLQTGQVALADENTKNTIQTYNEDDCRSTLALFNWLCTLRSALRDDGKDIPPPEKPSGEPSEHQTRHQQRVQPIFDALVEGLPADRTNHTPEQNVRYLMAHMLDFYGREDKKTYWDKYRLQETAEEDLMDESSALAFLEYSEQREQVRSSVIDTYTYPLQECDLRDGDTLLMHASELDIRMELVSLDRVNRIVRLKKSGKIKDIHPSAIFRHKTFKKTEKIERIIELANMVLDHRALAELPCAIDLLLRREPRTTQPIQADKDTLAGRVEWLLKLDNSVLPIQGPPGCGKTYTACDLIIALVRNGKKVGITALSHKIITKLLTDIRNKAAAEELTIILLQKPDLNNTETLPWRTTQSYDELLQAIPEVQVIGGTSNMWAHPNLRGSVDYLFVEEAGQLSLIDTLACCFATKNLVLLGDPQQLKQPLQGVHPEGLEVSALEHIFSGAQTIAPEQGVFLDTTWRMHPDICKFVSNLYYDGKLGSLPGLERQNISGNTRFAAAGLYFEAVDHSSNTTYSSEEADAVARIFNDLTKGDVYWEDAAGNKAVVLPEHIRIITPYNAQRFEIMQRIPGFTEVGTVDKFQGQQAPIVIYSMVTSSAEDIPRGMAFLYSPNRFNVAVSRSKAVFILVGAPALFVPECRTPEQMRLANAFAYYMEVCKK